jgi:hypothetical protein
MKALVKFGTVLAGYVAAVLAASGAVAVRIANTSGPDAQASAGMYAFGDSLLFIAVFSAVALFPTGLALWFLRPFRWFWVLSIAAMTLAATAILSASVYAVAAHLVLPRESPLAIGAAFAVLRMLLSPPLAAAFVLAGVIAPTWTSRWALLAAAGGEGAVAAYAVLHWFAGCCCT